MIMLAFVNDLSYMPIEGPLHLFLNRAIRTSTSIIASRVFTSLDLFLPVFPPVVPIISRLVNWCREALVPLFVVEGIWRFGNTRYSIKSGRLVSHRWMHRGWV